MDWTTITQLIGSIGFPIVMCVMLYNMIKEHLQKLIDSISQNNLEIAKFSDAINANTSAVKELKNEIARLERDLGDRKDEEI